MTQEIQFAQELIDFIHESPTAFHVVANTAKELEANGFEYLDIRSEWNIEKGGKYYTTKAESALFAFQIGNDAPEESGLRLISAHSDSPGFKIKPQPEMLVNDRYLKLNTEVYGGPILMTWLDRPLSLAGRVLLKGQHTLAPQSKLIDFRKPLLVIPSVAIHLNRSVNDGVELNKQVDMLPLMSIVNDTLEKDNYLLKIIADELKVDTTEILDFDLFVYEFEKGCLVGPNQEFISSPKLDDLAMVHAGLKAITTQTNTSATNILCVFDNEEVGSVTKQGAGSPVLRNIIERIMEKLGKSQEEYQRCIYQSFMISADMAHSVHPNHPEKHDPVLNPLMNEGPVIKIHANQKYTTDGESGAIFETICKQADVPVQKFVNRSDMVGGSTLGNVSTGKIDIRTVDIGNPMLGMHSVRELGGTLDHTYVAKAFTTFYNLD
ncbi:M18 family aminopeptidase [Carboxylicivirga sediminis]|uniref:M18 family aminopeptidase n=1 Tax=Carboxylicivirga sediminis TaxID=2006564 RepID=A0A941F463_9BACT|nr:M18 family aminopeptidase [Carboxylicivirga sediminis]MBR8535345.1 M18 family aminopeptidase [Carboxylicivirga sediminis]